MSMAIIDTDESMTIAEAADYLGVTQGRVSQLINDGTLAAQKVLGRWLIEFKSLKARKNNPPKTGRPGVGRKKSEETD